MPTWDELSPTNPTELSWDSLSTEPPPPRPDQGDFSRGVKESFQQLPQLGYGLMAGAGAAAESAFGEGGISTGIKKAGIAGYKEWGDKIAQDAKPSDSWDYSYNQAKEGNFGALVDWLQHGIGYVGGQAIQTLATGGIGAVGGKFVAGTAAKQIAEGMVAKEAAKIAATEAGAGMAASAISKLATANVAAKFAAVGQSLAVGANAFGMEGGEIFGDLTSQNKDRALTGSELGKAFAATLGAGALEFVGDKVGLDIMLGKSKLLKPTASLPGMAGRAARGAVAAAGAAPIEAGTEYAQTLAEEYGKGNDPFSEASFKQAKDAAMLGALGGTVVGGAGGAVHGAQQEVAPEPRPTPSDVLAAPTVDEAIATANAAISTPPNELLARQLQSANRSLLGAARDTQAQNQADAADLADLTQSETRNLQVMRAQLEKEQAKAGELEQIRAQSVETLGRLPDQQVSAAMAATDEAPTAMQLAMQAAQAKQAARTEVANDATTQPEPAPALASTEVADLPRLVDRQPGMVAMPQKLAQQRAAANPELEAVRIQNQNGKFAYTVISRTADVSPAVPVQPISAGTDQRGAPEPAPSLAPGVGPGSDTGTAVVSGRGGNLPSGGPVLSANQPAAVDPRLIPVSKRGNRENAAQTTQEARAGAEPAAVPDAGNATLPAVTQEQADGLTPAQAQQKTPQRQEAPATDQRLIPASKRTSPARPLRRAAYDKNPLLTFLATHGLFHDKSKPGSAKAEFSPDKGIMVSGYGPVFRKTGKRLDELVSVAIQDGYLPKDGTEAQLYDLIRRAVAGEKIQPMYAEGVAEAETERQMEARRALEEDQDQAQNEEVTPEDDAQGVEAVAALSDAELFALDDGIPMDASSNASTEDFLRAMGATEQEIQDAIAEETRVTQARDQGRAGAEETAASEAPGSDARGNEEARAGATELTTPTRADILAQQERADSATQSKEKADRAADKRAREEEDRKRIAKASEAAADTFELGGDAMTNLTGQKDIFSQPEESTAPTKPDDLSDIDPAALRKLLKSVKVEHQVIDDIKNDGSYVTMEVTAAESLKSIDEDLTNYKALLKCMKG